MVGADLGVAETGHAEIAGIATDGEVAGAVTETGAETGAATAAVGAVVLAAVAAVSCFSLLGFVTKDKHGHTLDIIHDFYTLHEVNMSDFLCSSYVNIVEFSRHSSTFTLTFELITT